VLGRTAHGFQPDAPFFVALRQDPILVRVYLIAEPWDAAPDGYQVGRFPGRFLEWNDRFRDAVRGWWLGRDVTRGELARRIAASSDLFGTGQRRPTASVNFISVHDGFTLADVVSYSRKHNAANGEDNRDGRDNELCANFGVEGPTDDPALSSLRLRIRRAMLATLLLSQGTPMLCAGDEFGNSQQGNNNAYCQDNPTGWLAWEGWPPGEAELCAFVADALALRREEALLRHDRWFGPQGPSLRWLAPEGRPLTEADWHDPGATTFSAWLTDAASGRQVLLAFHRGTSPADFALPAGRWTVALDSSGTLAAGTLVAGTASLVLPPHSVVVLRASNDTDTAS
jgi:glycogen operon protein